MIRTLVGKLVRVLITVLLVGIILYLDYLYLMSLSKDLSMLDTAILLVGGLFLLLAHFFVALLIRIVLKWRSKQPPTTRRTP